MCPNDLWKNVKLQTLHVNNLQPVTSKLSRDSTSLTSQFVQSYFNDCHHLCMFSHVTIQPSLQDMIHGQRISVLRKTPSCCSSAAAALVQQEGGWNSAPARDLWHQFVLVFTHCNKSMRCKSKRKMALTGMKFYKHPPAVSASLHIS